MRRYRKPDVKPQSREKECFFALNMQRWSLPEQAGRRKSQKWKRESSNERKRAVEQSFVRSPLMFNVSKSPRDRGNLLYTSITRKRRKPRSAVSGYQVSFWIKSCFMCPPGLHTKHAYFSGGEREKRRTEKTCQGNLSETLPLPYLFLFHRWTWSVTQKCPSHLKAVHKHGGLEEGRDPPFLKESESIRISPLKVGQKKFD